MNTIGLGIRSLRQGKRLTQEQLVAHCNLLGWSISRGTLAKIESKVRCVTDREVFLLASALKTDVNQLYTHVTLEEVLKQVEGG
jgi:transcriptional regulator with XRE-family HTH domain